MPSIHACMICFNRICKCRKCRGDYEALYGCDCIFDKDGPNGCQRVFKADEAFEELVTTA